MMRSRKNRLNPQSPNVWRTHNVWAFSLASLFSDWGHEMVTALLPGLLTAMGAPAIALGLTEGISNLAQSWAALWGGRETARYEGRHRVLRLGYLLTGLKALMALVSWWPLVVLLRTAAWLGRGARGPIRDAYIAEEVPPEHVGKAYGLRETFDTAGALLGPLTAAILVTFYGPRTLIALAAIPAAITVILIMRVHKLPPQPNPVSEGSPRGNISWPKTFVRYRAATGIFTAGYLAPTFFILQVWRSHVAWGPLSAHTIALVLYTWHNAVYAAGAYPAGRFADRTRGRTLLLTGYAMWAVAVLGFALNPASIALWFVLFGATGLSTGIIEVGQRMVTVRVVAVPTRGQGLGQIAAVRGIGQLLASVVMGVLWTLSNPRVGFGIEAGLACMGLMTMIWAVGTDGMAG